MELSREDAFDFPPLEGLSHLAWPLAQVQASEKLEVVSKQAKAGSCDSGKLKEWIENFLGQYCDYLDRSMYLGLLKLSLFTDQPGEPNQSTELFDRIFEKLTAHTNYHLRAAIEDDVDPRLICLTKLLTGTKKSDEIVLLLQARGDWALDLLAQAQKSVAVAKSSALASQSEKAAKPLTFLEELSSDPELASRIARWSVDDISLFVLADHKRSPDFWNVLRAVDSEYSQRLTNCPNNLEELALLLVALSRSRLAPKKILDSASRTLKTKLREIRDTNYDSEGLEECRDDITAIYRSIWELRENDQELDSLMLDVCCSGKLCLSNEGASRLIWCFGGTFSDEDFNDAWSWLETFSEGRVTQSFEIKVIGALRNTFLVDKYPSFPTSKKSHGGWESKVIGSLMEILSSVDPEANLERERCIGPFRVDLFFTFSDGSQGALELDGRRYHYINCDLSRGLVRSDVVRQDFLEQVMNVPVERLNGSWVRLGADERRRVLQEKVDALRS